jgi:hypothetical protein
VVPTAAELRAAAVRRARARAEHAAAARRRAKLAAVRGRRAKIAVALPVASPGSSSNAATPYLIVAFGAALLLLGLALMPAAAVPWRRASQALEKSREELAVLGAISLVATVFFLLLSQVTS